LNQTNFKLNSQKSIIKILGTADHNYNKVLKLLIEIKNFNI